MSNEKSGRIYTKYIEKYRQS